MSSRAIALAAIIRIYSLPPDTTEEHLAQGLPVIYDNFNRLVAAIDSAQAAAVSAAAVAVNQAYARAIERVRRSVWATLDQEQNYGLDSH